MVFDKNGKVIGEVNDYDGYELNITPILGQSLSLAIVHSIPPIHTNPIEGGFMLNSGVYQVNNTQANMNGIVQLVEGSDSWLQSLGKAQCENSAWGTAEMIKELTESFGGILEKQYTLYATCGHDGGSISKQFDTELDTLRNIFTRVKALMPYKKIGVPCIYWIQGESDNTEQTPIETYKEALINGIDAIYQIAREILGQRKPIKCITYQTSRGNKTHSQSGMAQMELCRDNALFAPSCPMYVGMLADDHAHISNWAQYLLGCYQGIQFYKWVANGHKQVGVMPLSFSRSGTKITIKFAVECPPLKFCTDWVTNRTHYGFEVIRNGSDIISNVSIKDIDTVEITCTSTVQAGDLVAYACQTDYGDRQEGSAGNLCDSQGDSIKCTVDGTEVSLNNYCFKFLHTME